MVSAEYTGKRIYELRQTKGWTQKQLAEKTGVTDKAVSKWERGINYPDLALLEPLAKVLETTVADLLGLEDSPESNEALETTTRIWINEKEDLKAEFRKRIRTNIVYAVVVIICGLVLAWTVCERGVSLVAVNIIVSWTILILGNSVWLLKKYKKVKI